MRSGRSAPALDRPRLLSLVTVAQYVRLRRRAHQPYEQVVREQSASLCAMVRHARRNVSLYRELYAEVPETDRIELSRLPFLSKEMLWARSDDDRRCAPACKLSRRLFTSGTTGEALATDWSPYAAWWQGVLTLRMASCQGLIPGHRRASIVWVPDRRPVHGLFARLRRRHAHLMATEGPEALARMLQELGPDALWGHAHQLIEIGEALEGSWRPRVVNPAGEELTREHRAELRSLYRSEPLDVYSSSEQGLVAWQCREADLYHINHEAAIVEVLDGGGDPVPAGTSGELVITGLCNSLMPYLRYRTGDAAVMATRPCRCGATLPALERIEGRLLDWLRDDHGQRVAPQRLWLSAHAEDGLSLVHRYHVRQERSGAVTVLLVPRREIEGEFLRQLERSYQRLLGAGTPVEVRLTDRLEDDGARKVRTVMAAS
jgi:phenylacetate-CoA ligase